MDVDKRQALHVVGYAPAGLKSKSFGIPVAVARAGGIGVLDLEFGNARNAENVVLGILNATTGKIGLRFGGRHPQEFKALLKHLKNRSHWVVVSQEGERDLASRLKSLIQQFGTQSLGELVVEVTNASKLSELDDFPVAAVIAKGNEAGGHVGEDSSFILLQKLLNDLSLPVYVEGGIGLNGAAACYSVGAAGIVLSGQLMLMPESPLPAIWQDELRGLAGMEARVYGERLGRPIRVLARPGYAATEALLKCEEELEASGASSVDWIARSRQWVGWDEPGKLAWPVGQEMGLALKLSEQFKTTGRLIGAMVDAAARHAEICRNAPPLREDAPLARSHGTKYPIVQGPMTRVSDSPKFANDVAKAGALPFLALALMRGPQALSTLRATAQLLGDKPWGVGLLGFVPQQLREAQTKAIFEVKPPFALIAGGRPDQAAEFERNGIPAYIHVPAPELLKLFIEQGAKRFIFEGRECGGHVGPLSSFMLWETMINVLLEYVPAGQESHIHVLFAGGIHDAKSAALVSVMAAPLVKRGFNIGVLMGTAYLFTNEIVESGAIKQRYQIEAMSCDATINLETGPGHASRCAVSPFSHHFYQERARIMAEKRPAEEVRDHLEDLNLGRLRLASKGSTRRNGGELVNVDEKEQIQEGMYMLGQVATLRDRTLAAKTLHQEVSEGSAALLDAAPKRTELREREVSPSDIAIVGIGTLLPKAQSADKYWLNIVNKVNAITETPKHRWDSRLYFDADRHKRDKIYSKWGGFLDDVEFDPMNYGIPPNSLKSIEPLQLLALETARRALEDAGYASGDFDREHTSVILGAGGGAGDLGMQYAVRSELPRFVESPLDTAFNRLPEWTEESFPGLLLNVVAGRIANRFDLGGTNCIVDAACASSLAAFDIAVNELETGRSKVALVGGVDTVQSPFGYLCFSKTQALSPRGKANTFDKCGDGIVISEGLAMVVLKPLADAERDGDKIYSVIKSIGSSSDGKALGLTAPLPAGQMRALKRAYQKAGIKPSTVGLLEAHGTGTAVGDSAEVETITQTLHSDSAEPRSVALGSVKAQLGHTKATAGTAGLVKAVLALHHKVLPPHVGVENPLNAIADEDSPVYLLDEARPWLRNGHTPRRAGVSAFGFGGTNFHVVMEEYQGEFRANAQPLGASEWPAELLVFGAATQAALKSQVSRIATSLDAGAKPRLADLAYTCAMESEKTNSSVRAAVVVATLAQLSQALNELVRALDRGDTTNLSPNIQVCLDTSIESPDVALLFPGQGAQYTGMLREATLFLREPREALEYADTRQQGVFDQPLSKFIYPSQAYSAQHKARQDAALTNTHVAQPAIVATSLGYLETLKRVGLKASMAAGHSLGEYVALYAAGAISRDTLLDLAQIRGKAMSEVGSRGESGSMAAVMAERTIVEKLLSDYSDVVLANHNAPKQCVISGPTEEVAAVMDVMSAQGVSAMQLPVAGAFHSPIMEQAQSALTTAIENAEIHNPQISVYSNEQGEAYPSDGRAIREQLKTHMLGSVQFVDQINNMYDSGARVFVEVGPNNVLSGLVGKILKDRSHVVVSTDRKNKGISNFLGTLAQLIGCGVEIKASALFDDRNVTRLSATLPLPSTTATTWLVTGGSVRRPNDEIHKTGSEPALTFESRKTSMQELAHRIAPQQTAPRPERMENTQHVETDASGLHSPPASSVGSMVGSIPPATPFKGTTSSATQALDLYHNTMRQFLAMQENVMQTFLTGGSHGVSATSPAILSTSEDQAPVLPVGDRPPAPSAAVSDALNPPVSTSANSLSGMQTKQESPVAPATGNAPVFGQEELTALVLKLTADRTGYPPDMLALDQDIEAELGIDSIKRVEIVGAISKELPEAMQAALQSEVEALTRAKTLAALIESLSTYLPKQPVALTQPLTQPLVHEEIVAVDPSLSAEQVSNLVLKLTSDRTGYPIEMLALDQDIEAELGIDSIKRVEIVGALIKELPESVQSSLQSEVESLTKAKTLGALIDSLAVFVPESQSAANSPALPAPMAESTVAKSAVATIQPIAQTITQSAPTQSIHGSPGLSRSVLEDIVLRLTADRTGYPVDMLTLDQDIEAELGIDSIKRVEIIGALTKELPAEMQNSLQSQVETLTRSKTLGLLIDGLAEHLPTSGSTQSVASLPTQRSSSSIDQLDGIQLKELVLRLTSERTGYPVEMLSLDQDIEAELGIDSIKRVEIVGAITKSLPEAVQVSLQSEVESLTRAKTLARLLEDLSSHLNTDVSSSTTTPLKNNDAPKLASLSVVADAAMGVPRFVMASKNQPLPPIATASPPGLYLVIDDGNGLSALLIRQLERRGHEVALVTHDVLNDRTRLSKTIDNLRADSLPIVGIVNLACLHDGNSMTSLRSWREAGNRHNKALFRLLKTCAPDFSRKHNVHIVNVSGNGGSFGRDGVMISPTSGGSVGLLKSALAEWPTLQIKNLDIGRVEDFNPSLIVDELLCEVDAVEVGYSNGKRHIFFTTSAPVNPQADTSQRSLLPQDGAIILATGGARGITFNVLEEIVPNNATVVLMARSKEPAEESLSLAQATDAAALRSKFLQKANSNGEKLSLAQLEKRVNAVLRDRSVRSNLQALRQRGIVVDYIQADVSNEQQCNEAIDGIYERHGRIDGVIHGAGIIEDKLIIDKTQESFDRVYDTKADSGYILSQRLRPDSLRWLMFFTSVAGRYGNRGQGDYAAGNEVLNRLAWYLNGQWPNTRVMSINWGPWDSGGMVSDGVKRQFAELGIIAIAPDSGVKFAREELAFGRTDDVEVIAGQGPWDSEASQIAKSPDAAAKNSDLNLVLTPSLPDMEPTGAVVMSRAFSLSIDPYLDDHRLDGDPVVPAAVCTEWMAETTQLGWPDLVVAEVQDVRVLQGIQFKEGESAPLQVRCKVSSHADASSVRVSTELKDMRNDRVAYRTGVLLRNRLPRAPQASIPSLSGGESVDALTAYRDYLFHGPRFQLIDSIEKMNEEGIDATIRTSDVLKWVDQSRHAAGDTLGWLFDPGLVDVGLQMSMIWVRAHKGISALPARFGAIRRYHVDAPPNTLQLLYRVRPEASSTAVVFDAEFCTPDGQVFMAMEDIESIGSSSFNRLADETDEVGQLIVTKLGKAQ